jgi:hypothetical protein
VKLRNKFLAAVALSAVTLASHAARAQTPVVFSGAAALALPIGDLGNAADPGINLAIRGEGRLGSPGWYLRGDLSWDRFGGRGPVDSYSYLGAAANLVHRESKSRLYEFGGLGIYGSKVNFSGNVNSSDTNLGLQMGLGLDLNPGPHTPFVEFGLTSVFTTGGNSVWFPVKFGVRF